MPTAGVHCAFNKLKLGGQLLNIIPPASLHFSAGQYCDEAPKTEEAIERYFGERVFWCNRCQDEDYDDPPADERHLKYLSRSLDKAIQVFSDVIGTEVTKELVMQGILAGDEFAKQVANTMLLRVGADPSPIRIGSYGLVLFLPAAITGVNRIKEAEEALRVLYQEVRERVDRGDGVVERGAPRVMVSYTPSLSDPGQAKAMEDAGLNVACAEDFCAVALAEGRQEIVYTDPSDIIAAVFLHGSVMIKPTWRIESMVKAYRKANLDGIIMLPHHSCRLLSTDCHFVRDGLKKELGDIPVSILETDLCDARYHNTKQAITRIESFAEMVRSARAHQ